MMKLDFFRRTKTPALQDAVITCGIFSDVIIPELCLQREKELHDTGAFSCRDCAVRTMRPTGRDGRNEKRWIASSA